MGKMDYSVIDRLISVSRSSQRGILVVYDMPNSGSIFQNTRSGYKSAIEASARRLSLNKKYEGVAVCACSISDLQDAAVSNFLPSTIKDDLRRASAGNLKTPCIYFFSKGTLIQELSLGFMHPDQINLEALADEYLPGLKQVQPELLAAAAGKH